MTEYGKYKLSKRNKTSTLLASICLLAALFFNSCASLKQSKRAIEPFTLLQEDADIYLSIPVSNNKKMLSKILIQMSDDYSDGFDTFLNRTDRICMAYTFVDENIRLVSSYQVIIQGHYSTLFSSFIFTKNNGFYKIESEEDDGEIYSYWQNKQSNMQTALPLPTMIFASSDSVIPMQQKFNLSSKVIITDVVVETNLSEKQLTFLNNNDMITMYIAKPGNLIPRLLGANAIKLAINQAFVSLQPIYNSTENTNFIGYNVSLNLDMTNTQAQTIGFMLLNFVKKTNSFTVEKIGTKKLFIDGYFVSIQDIIKMLK